jgi:hypothetical protein
LALPLFIPDPILLLDATAETGSARAQDRPRFATSQSGPS